MMRDARLCHLMVQSHAHHADAHPFGCCDCSRLVLCICTGRNTSAVRIIICRRSAPRRRLISKRTKDNIVHRLMSHTSGEAHVIRTDVRIARPSLAPCDIIHFCFVARVDTFLVDCFMALCDAMRSILLQLAAASRVADAYIYCFVCLHIFHLNGIPPLFRGHSRRYDIYCHLLFYALDNSTRTVHTFAQQIKPSNVYAFVKLTIGGTRVLAQLRLLLL